jgi:hypothetical protein
MKSVSLSLSLSLSLPPPPQKTGYDINNILSYALAQMTVTDYGIRDLAVMIMNTLAVAWRD